MNANAPIAIAEAQQPAQETRRPAQEARPGMPPFVPKSLPWNVIYVISSIVLGITQGLGLNLVTANLTGLQASFGATATEMAWLPTVYFATNMTGTIVMFKIRSQFGMRRFAELGIIVYALIVLAHLFVHDLQSAIWVRAIMGIAAAPLSTLAFFYMLEWLPPAKKMSIGLCFGMLGSSLSLPLARVISPDLLALGDWQGLYMVEAGLALVSLAIVFLVPLVPPPRAKVFDKDDLVSLPLMAAGFAAMAIVLGMGRVYWWLEAPWIGVLLAIGIGSLVSFCLVELHRKNPIIDLRWLFSRDMLIFAGSLIVLRLLLSEQSVGVFGLFTVLNLQNDQLIGLFGLVGVATFAATAGLSMVMKPNRVPIFHLIALVLIAIAAWMDSQSTVLSRPEQFYISQALIGIATGLFLPPAMLHGFLRALARGPQYILSFLTVFLTTQSLGGLLGSAIFGTFVTVREQFHSNVIAQGITLLDPLVAQRVQAYGGAYARVLTDPAQRDAKGLALLGQSASQQANVLAYNDLFLLIFAATLVAIAVLLTHLALAALSKSAAPLQAQPA
ncbi:MFS transporter [Devosia yakushimensis]|uniref:MFS transporter n=1 Tax=Devosia yakushimensis TaxID=470028 RepID=A0ABQ5UFU2_9HYPH|nr:MFS transporter [Devosia yakushimensis]GLQ10972.1 MFS transporter [Devosia yakushimensis]